MANNYNHISEEELVELLRNKDRKSMEILYEKYNVAIFGVINRIVQSQELAEDLVQEAFVKIWKSFDSYSSQKGRLFTWMINVSRNLAIDKLRSKSFKNNSKNQNIEDNVFIIDNVKNHKLNSDVVGLKDLTEKLKPNQKEIIDLVYFSGYTHVEVSEELGIPLGTVKTSLRMGLMELRKYFN
ncbi:MAG: RNA polymerase sigma factor (sigma-70 family) [Sphingobacteriales bacterium]